MRRTRKVQKKSPLISRIKRANRGFRNVMRQARTQDNVRYVYDIKYLQGVTTSKDADVIKYNSCRVTDFLNVNALLQESATSTNQPGYTEYRVAKAFVKYTPRNPNYVRLNSLFNVNPGNHPWIGAWPLSHFGSEPTGSNIPTQRVVALSNSVKRISVFKTNATHMPMNALMEQLITINDGETTAEIISVPAQRMPFIEYKNTVAENPRLMPFASYLPKAADDNSLISWDIEYHVIFALRRSRHDVTEM